jgi:hypothetical protein
MLTLLLVFFIIITLGIFMFPKWDDMYENFTDIDLRNQGDNIPTQPFYDPINGPWDNVGKLGWYVSPQTQYYYNQTDCITVPSNNKNTCRQPPNNDSFFAYKPEQNITPITKLQCHSRSCACNGCQFNGCSNNMYGKECYLSSCIKAPGQKVVPWTPETDVCPTANNNFSSSTPGFEL